MSRAKAILDDAPKRVRKEWKGVDLAGVTFVMDGMDEYGVEEAIRHAITGHEGSTVHEKVYAATVRRHAARLRPHVEKITYPTLALPKVYESKRREAVRRVHLAHRSARAR